MSNKPPKKSLNPFKAAGLRHPSNLPQSVQWQVEGDAELMKKLSPEEQIWLAAFDEAEFGGNPSEMTNDTASKRKAWNANSANNRDLMTLGKGNDRVSLERLDNVQKREPSLWPSKAELREKVSIDAVQRDTASNSVEDAVIALIDATMANRKVSQKSPKRRRKKTQ